MTRASSCPRGPRFAWHAASCALALLALAACAPEARPTAHRPVAPPVATPDAIPDAPLGGTIRGAKFALGDARYVADHRPGHVHVDVLLSAGRAEASCGDVGPAGATSVWMRLERSDEVEATALRLEPGKPDAWSVHYQVREDGVWTGSADAAAVASILGAGPDGRIAGGLAVCFADDAGSCVSGSFDAEPCPPAIDAPVRGALPPETIPEKYRKKLLEKDAGPPAGAAAP